MKKTIAILVAVLLAFGIAFSDRLFHLDFSGSGFKNITSLLTGNRKKPRIPKSITSEPIEENLSYAERLEKGAYYYEKGFLNFAINEYVKASNLDSTQILPYRRLMEIHFELLNYDKVRANAEEILKIKADDFTAQYFLALVSVKQSRFEEAKNRIVELQNEGVNDIRLLYLTSLLQISENQHEEGKKNLAKIIATENPVQKEVVAHASRILEAYQEFEFAEGSEELYLSVLLVRALNEVEEYELAIYKLKEILKDRSDLRDAWILLGFAYLNLEKYMFATTAFERAYELDPEWPATQYFLGLTYAELSRNEDAIIYLNYALSNGFEPAVIIHQKLADLYLEVQNYQKSVNAYEKVLEVNTQDINSYNRPIWIYLDFLNQPERALELAQQAMINFPNEPFAYNLLGWAQMGVGNVIEAEKNLKKATQDDPEMPAAHYNLGQLYEKQEDFEKALDAYEKAYEIDQNGSIGNLAAKKYNALLIQLEN